MRPTLVDTNNLPPKQALSTYWSLDLVKFKASVDEVVRDEALKAEDEVIVCKKWDSQNKANIV